MKNIAVFGTSWSDPFYDENTRYTPNRNKTWTEFLGKYYSDFHLHTFAYSGGSNDLAMAMLTSLLADHKTTKFDWDLIIYEIPPLMRQFVPVDETFEWNNEFGFMEHNIGNPLEDRFMIVNREGSLDDNHTVYNKMNIDAWNVSPMGVFYTHQDENNRRCDEVSILVDNKEMRDRLSNLSFVSSDFHINRALYGLAALENISKEFNTRIITITMDDPMDNPNFKRSHISDQNISGGYYPSNVGLSDILNQYAKIYPRKINENINEEWWVDFAHPTQKGWEWILDNILIKSEKFKAALDNVFNL